MDSVRCRMQSQYTMICCIYMYIPGTNSWKCKLRNNPIYNHTKKKKIPRNKFRQGCKRPIHWWLWDIAGRDWRRHNKWKDIPCSRAGRINTVLLKSSCYPKQSTDSVGPYQNSNSIFHRNRSNDYEICVEPQRKTFSRQSSLENEEQSCKHRALRCQTIFQSYKN